MCFAVLQLCKWIESHTAVIETQLKSWQTSHSIFSHQMIAKDKWLDKRGHPTGITYGVTMNQLHGMHKSGVNYIAKPFYGQCCVNV